MIAKTLDPEALEKTLFNPTGIDRWNQYTVAEEVRAAIIEAIDGLAEVWITRADARLIAKTAEVLRCGNPGFGALADCGNSMGQPLAYLPKTIVAALGA
jgi:hypothetical protein